MRLALAFLCTACAASESVAPNTPPPALRASEPAHAPAAVAAPSAPRVQPEIELYAWVLPFDRGIRNDKSGQGAFLAPRYHGMHNGIDLLAPIGTPVLAPCTGKASAGKNPSHGKWLHLACKLPARNGMAREAWVSFFFAHLSSQAFGDDALHDVRRGETIGAVGKTGNASGGSVAPHLHLEAIIQDTEETALAEHHSGRDQSNNQAAESTALALQAHCVEPSGLERRGEEFWRARRVDPFVLLSCFGAVKPAYARPSGEWAEASTPWSLSYSATAFDVNAGSVAWLNSDK